MSSELKMPDRRAAGVRLNPLPAKNTLLTVIFFSAVAAAIGYWIFFPPVAATPPKNPATPTASPAAIASAVQPAQRD